MSTRDPVAHRDGTPHSADGPSGCYRCSAERRKVWPALSEAEKREIHVKACEANARMATPASPEEEAETKVAQAFINKLFGQEPSLPGKGIRK